jgi:hypothetical protein
MNGHRWGRRATRRTLAALAALVGALLVAAVAVAGPHAAGTGGGQADRLRAIEQARLQALVAGDTATARGLMAPDFQVINPAGIPLARDQLLAGIDAGEPDFFVDEPASPIAVRLYGNAAVLRYQESFDLVIAGTRLTHQAWSTVLYERRGGRWQVVWVQTTAIPNRLDLLLEALKPLKPTE